MCIRDRVSTLAKLLNPKIKVIGVEPAGAACLKASLKKGKPVTLDKVSTIADGTAVKTPGQNIFSYLQQGLDDVITVEDDELVVAFLDMVENHKPVSYTHLDVYKRQFLQRRRRPRHH